MLQARCEVEEADRVFGVALGERLATDFGVAGLKSCLPVMSSVRAAPGNSKLCCGKHPDYRF